MPGMSPVARPPRHAASDPSQSCPPGAGSPGRRRGRCRIVSRHRRDGPGTPSRPAPTREAVRDGHERGGIAVGPGLAGPALRVGAGGYRMNPLQVQPAKIHCPPPRDDTLSRERLNTWLERAASGRLGLIVAEAGFGKTTLLADWAIHTRRRTTWYRLEPDDRDWLTFIRHLVAGRSRARPGVRAGDIRAAGIARARRPDAGGPDGVDRARDGGVRGREPDAA